MGKRILVDANYPEETRVVLLNDSGQLELLEYERTNKEQIKGNIYLAKIVRVEPSLQAAFIEYGTERNGFLPFSEIHQDYYHIPVSDREENNKIVSLQSIAPPDITAEDIAEQERTSDTTSRATTLNSEIELDASDLDTDADTSLTNDQYRQYKIQDVIKKGQVVLVQAQKEERGNKGASFSTYISLAGKCCVLVPNRPGQNGISKKIANLSERKRLRDIVSGLCKDDSIMASVIVRTAGLGKTTYEIKRDYDYLVRLWNSIREATMRSKAPAFIHMEDGIILKTIRNIMDSATQEVLVQGKEAYKIALDFIRSMSPTDEHKIKEYTSKTPIFTKFNIESQLSTLYQPISSLPSGGYIVINPTEALISIDVNSGRATAERNIEETAVKTNLEAAAEIARQLKLRDLSGLVVVDFIDMYEAKNRKLVEKVLRQNLASDRARIQTSDISAFGLLELSRQRLKSSFLETYTKVCSHCQGKGLVRADEANSMLILRTIENEIFKQNIDKVSVYAHPEVITYILNNRRSEISAIEAKHSITLHFLNDYNSTSDSFSIEKVKYQHTVEQGTHKPVVMLSSSTNALDTASTPEKPAKPRHNHHKPARDVQEQRVVAEPEQPVQHQPAEIVEEDAQVAVAPTNPTHTKARRKLPRRVNTGNRPRTPRVHKEVESEV